MAVSLALLACCLLAWCGLALLTATSRVPVRPTPSEEPAQHSDRLPPAVAALLLGTGREDPRVIEATVLTMSRSGWLRAYRQDDGSIAAGLTGHQGITALWGFEQMVLDRVESQVRSRLDSQVEDDAETSTEEPERGAGNRIGEQAGKQPGEQAGAAPLLVRVPLAALLSGGDPRHSAWWRAFADEVSAAAVALGLLHPPVRRSAATVLTVGSTVPALALAAVLIDVLGDHSLLPWLAAFLAFSALRALGHSLTRPRLSSLGQQAAVRLRQYSAQDARNVRTDTL
jgi:hypothetical protein